MLKRRLIGNEEYLEVQEEMEPHVLIKFDAILAFEFDGRLLKIVTAVKYYRSCHTRDELVAALKKPMSK